AADLALARQRWPGDPTTAGLEELVGRARHLVYASERRRESAPDFFSTGYWRLVRERTGMVVLCWALMLVPAVLMGVWAATDPPAASELLPGDYRSVGNQAGGDLGLPIGTQAALAGQILTNNIQVSFLAFAAGIAAGVGTAVVLAYNGVIIGGVAGLAAAGGSSGPLVELVAPHGVLELSVITVAGMAGMTIGWALVDPGRRSRRDAVPLAARQGAAIVLGTAPWFVVAGMVEGFVTPTGLGPGPAVAFGATLGAVYWGLVIWRGRPEKQSGLR
ncbi:MAG: stage II sporulation protein M, partial [Acidimicrobiia bacterium]